jgi:hypothetical protein
MTKSVKENLFELLDLNAKNATIDARLGLFPQSPASDEDRIGHHANRTRMRYLIRRILAGSDGTLEIGMKGPAAGRVSVTIRQIDRFTAAEVEQWVIRDSDITLVTDAGIPVELARENMIDDLLASTRLTMSLPVVQKAKSFRGQLGIDLHGRGWKLHLPSDAAIPSLSTAAEFASKAGWMKWGGVSPAHHKVRTLRSAGAVETA